MGKVAGAAEFVKTQDAADGGATQAGGLRDARAGTVLAEKSQDQFDELGLALARGA